MNVWETFSDGSHQKLIIYEYENIQKKGHMLRVKQLPVFCTAYFTTFIYSKMSSLIA